MGVACSPDIFKEKMSGLMQTLEYVKTYLDDLLVLTKGKFTYHLPKLELVLHRLLQAGFWVNVEKSTFDAGMIEYLGYLLTREGISPLPNKVQAILALLPPKNIKALRHFLGMVQFYHDIWEKRS